MRHVWPRYAEAAHPRLPRSRPSSGGSYFQAELERAGHYESKPIQTNGLNFLLAATLRNKSFATPKKCLSSRAFRAWVLVFGLERTWTIQIVMACYPFLEAKGHGYGTVFGREVLKGFRLSEALTMLM